MKMNLIRFGPAGKEKPGIINEKGERLDCSGVFRDWDREFFATDGLNRLSTYLQKERNQLPVVSADVRYGSCVARPGKVVCIGLNYSDHAAESKLELPREPLIFMKGSNTVVGPYDNLLLPRGSSQTDWEVELGVVIGKEARYLSSVESAGECIAGYCISHDVSERSFQFERGGQWTKGKSCDTFNPLGPWLRVRDHSFDPLNLSMTLEVNGINKQNGSTASMVFKPLQLVHYLSQFMTLEPGDLISTGTPPGVGFGRTPKEFLKEGDVVTLRIEGLGSQQQRCVLA
jgi:2-keto-4-pentenoate hydratase/2-oxohepta-3-ene-1,7-dioic acid hydratase in catechol pathway